VRKFAGRVVVIAIIVVAVVVVVAVAVVVVVVVEGKECVGASCGENNEKKGKKRYEKNWVWGGYVWTLTRCRSH
jgi:flagellar basal body-associated protein FliL